MDVDPRPWNLLAGLAIATGCGNHSVSADADSNDSVDEGSESSPETEAGLEYSTQHDGNIPDYECYTDSECDAMRLCEDHVCVKIHGPPPWGPDVIETEALEIPEAPLGLVFADVDDDGARELVVASQTQLHVYESGSPMPVSYPRGSGSDSVDAMAGGQFDFVAGEDVIVLYQDQFAQHGSDGMGNLLPADPTPTDYPSTRGLVTGTFSLSDFTDLLVWGGQHTGIIYTEVGQQTLLVGDTTSASARDYGQPGQGFSLLHSGNRMTFFGIAGNSVGDVVLRGNPPHSQSKMVVHGNTLELGSSSYGNWTLVQVFDLPNLTTYWAVWGTITHMRAGDLDGLDDVDELAIILDGGTTVADGLRILINNSYSQFVPLDGQVLELALGDHDGDGDDELAVRTAANTVWIVDAE